MPEALVCNRVQEQKYEISLIQEGLHAWLKTCRLNSLCTRLLVTRDIDKKLMHLGNFFFGGWGVGVGERDIHLTQEGKGVVPLLGRVISSKSINFTCGHCTCC